MQWFKTFPIFMLLLGLLSSCNGIGTAEFGEVASGSTGSGGSSAGETTSFGGISSVDQKTDTTLRLNWTAHADAVAYDVYNLTSGTPVWMQTVNGQASSSVTLTGLTPNQLYKYRVRAKDSQGVNDSNTNDVSVTTNLAPDIPSGVALVDPATSPDFDTTPILRVSGVKNGDTIKVFTDATCTTQVGSAVSTGATIDITTNALAANTYAFYANATGPGGTSTCSTANVAYVLNACPTNYVSVPADAGLGVSAFCVMKHEARAWNDADADDVIDAGEIDADGCGEGACTTAGWGSANIPGATSEGLPWRRINQNDAKAECQSLNAKFGVANKFDLISNPEWIAITRNAEGVDANWSNGTVGDGCLFRGNNGTADACGYNGSDPETGEADTKAKLTLSNGSEVWHLSGNVWEWTDWTTGGTLDPGPTTCNAAWTELPSVACGALADADYNTQNGAYTSADGVGQLYGGAGGAALRGGRWINGAYAGAFALNLNNAPSGTYTSIGFRCVFRP